MSPSGRTGRSMSTIWARCEEAFGSSPATGTRRVYFCQGQFRSLAYLLNLSGNMVFTLDYRESRTRRGADAGGRSPAVRSAG